MTFDLSSTAECGRCGNQLTNSDEECTECSVEECRRYHFEHISDDRVVTTYSLNDRKWHDLMQIVDEPLPWKCVETGHMTAHLHQMGIDVRELWREYHE